MKRDVEAFKNELRNLHYYTDKIMELDEEIGLLVYEMENVKGINYSKQSGNSYNPDAVEQKKLAMVEEYNEMLKKKNNFLNKLNDIYVVLNRMPMNDRTLVVGVIADRKRYRDVCEELGMGSTSILHNRINDIIEEAL